MTATLATGPSHGTLSFNADGTFVYTSDVDFFGEDSFTYTATDGVATSTATVVTLNVQNTADDPIAIADAYMVGTDMLLTVPTETGVLANDLDADGDDLTAMIVRTPTNGSLVFQPDGSFTYQPSAGFEGLDSFTYKARDRFIESSSATVTITVAEPGSIPTITTAAEEYTMREDRELTVDAASGVLSNDTISNGAMLTATIVTQPENGTLTLNADGSLSYTPDPNYAGIDTFGYIASSGTVSSAEQLSTIRVQAVNDAPMGVDDNYTATVDLPLIIAAPGVLANDSDVEGDSLTASILTQPSNGLVILNEDGSFTYQPSFAFTGEDSFTYVPNDLFSSDGATDESRATTVTITVSPESSGSITTESDSYLLLEDQVHNESAETGVLANDMGDDLTVAISSQPANGSVELQADGSFTYTPNSDFFGEDIFTYTASNAVETSSETEVHLHVQPVNDRPIALADSYDVDSGATLTVNAVDGVLGNDLELDNEPLTALLIDDPANGTLTLNEDGSLEYTPNPSFSGIDTFTYIATDATRDSDVTTVTITVGTSTEFMAVDDLYQLREDGVLRIAANAGVLVNDVASPVGNTVSVASEPMFGSIMLNADGSFEYTPQQDFTGDDTFTYTASAGGDNATATVTVRISNRPDAPVANDDDFYMTGVGETLTTNPLNGILANDTDGDGDSLTAVPLTTPDSGTLVVNGDGTFTYTPEDGFTGFVTFTYTARDDGGSVSNVATVTIQVGDPPAAATAIPGNAGSGVFGDADLIDEAFADDRDLNSDLL